MPEPVFCLPACLSCLLLVAMPALAEVEIRGQVRSEAGEPVVGARIEARRAAGGVIVQEAVSGDDGGFLLPGVAPPVELLVSHPAFVATTMEVASDGDRWVEIAMAGRAHYEDDVTVRGRGLGDRFSPRSVASTAVVPQEASVPPRSVVEAVAGVAGVAENGQGGLLQVASVRGLSGQRVLSHIDGARVTSERRAGTALSFLDPTLIVEVDVLRGPASTYYGSGALGGALQVRPRRFELLSSELGYGSGGDERWFGFGAGAPRWSLGLAHRRRADGASPAGERLHDGFVQSSATAEVRFGPPRRGIRVSGVASLGEDIGKSNLDFPARKTTYPRERHLLLSVGSEAATWRARAFIHPHDLRTEVVDETFRDVVENETLDFGLMWEQEVVLGAAAEGRFGFDTFGRRGVDALERRTRLDGGDVTELASLLGGQEDEAALLGVVNWRWGRARLEAGGRGTWIRQAAKGEETESGSHLTGFVGAALEVHRRVELIANVGRGFRVATLSERFFVGTTGRGEVVGNPDLDPESALSTELALRYLGDRTFVRLSVYRNHIADYIERFELEPRRFSFRNLGSGEQLGVELSGLVRLDDSWSLSYTGHRIRGEDQDGRVLADLPADRVRLEPRYAGSRLSISTAVTWRRSRREVGSGEVPLDGALLVDASLGWRWARDFTTSLVATNLFDELYFPTADKESTVAPGRSVGFRLSWRGR